MLHAADYAWAVEHGLLPATLDVTLGDVVLSGIDVDAHDLRLRQFDQLPKARLVFTFGDPGATIELSADAGPLRHASVAVPWPTGFPDPCIEVQLVEVDMSGGCRDAQRAVAEVEGLAEDGLAHARRQRQRVRRQRRRGNRSLVTTPMAQTLSVPLGGAASMAASAESPLLDASLQPDLSTSAAAASPCGSPHAAIDGAAARVHTLDYVAAIDDAVAALEDAEASAASYGLRMTFTLPLKDLADRSVVLEQRNHSSDTSSSSSTDPHAPRKEWWKSLCNAEVAMFLCPHHCPERKVFAVALDLSDQVGGWITAATSAVRTAAFADPGRRCSLRQLEFRDDRLDRVADALEEAEVAATVVAAVPLRGAWRPGSLECRVTVRCDPAPLAAVSRGVPNQVGQTPLKTVAAAVDVDTGPPPPTEASLSLASRVQLARAVDEAVDYAARAWQASMAPLMVRLDQLDVRLGRLEGDLRSKASSESRARSRFARALEHSATATGAAPSSARHLSPGRNLL